ncbi:MAG: tRNA (N(6)-L-threonylcarbamoyladenosine(37)-C(2))-methylthiotransferase MtaB [Chloroflexi bacterium]|nr:tRNA (N(6)-L-threonylcarbamoyladenosine(37)-C(2))-methylthiotransferase MtaB [Chloroflexota bacterium]
MKIFLDTIGCRLNQSEIENMARQFRAAGHEIVGEAAQADVAVVNTCTVTSEAASDSRAKIRGAARAGVEDIIATGCWATMEPGKAAALPNVRRVIVNDRKESLVADLLDISPESFELEPIARQPLPGLRARTRAFIKVQDGCDNACTFCITTVARGEGRSRSVDDVIADVRSALDGGTREIVLTGVHLGSWGRDGSATPDASSGLPLRHLVESILAQTDVPRLRLSSLEPWDLDADFFTLWEDPRLCRHLHLPLQSGSEAVLRRMRRHTTRESFRELVAAARAVMPDAAITTDVIAGFPGETDDEFAETLAFVREMNFAGGHVFTYSPREGTPAARMKNHVPKKIRKERNAALRQAFSEMGASYRRGFLGQTRSVLWESVRENGSQGWLMSGLTDNYIRINAYASEPRWNRVDDVVLHELTADGIRGVIRN